MSPAAGDGLQHVSGCGGRASGLLAGLETDSGVRRSRRFEEAAERGAAFVAVRPDGAVLLRKRAETGLLGGMAEIPGTAWTARIRGLRANASRMSHAELDEAEELDMGDPEELAHEYLALREKLPSLTVLGGCCGTDHRHVEAMCRAWA